MTAFDTEEDKLLTLVPDHEVNAREAFDVDFDAKAPAFTTRDPHVPDLTRPTSSIRRPPER